MSSKKKKKSEYSGLNLFGVIMLAILVIFSMAYYLAYKHINNNYQILERNMGGSVHDDKSIYVRIDMSQPGSLAVFKNLQQNCLKLNIRSCMSTEDLLNLKK